MKKSTAETISYAITKECQRRSLSDWCEDWDITVDEFYEFLSLAVNNAELQNKMAKDEKHNKIIQLPCEVGDTVWVVTSPFNVFDDIEYDEDMPEEVYESYISSVTFYKNSEQYRIAAKGTNHFIGAYFRNGDFGKSIFFTKSEADNKLNELKKNREKRDACKEDVDLEF